MEYDFLIVGAGLFGSVCARELTDKGYKCVVVEQRDHIGGNCYSVRRAGIDIHKYGSHIFHTNDNIIWNYIHRFSNFNQYQHKTVVNHLDTYYSFPINLMTLQQVFGTVGRDELLKMFEESKTNIKNPKNLEEFCLNEKSSSEANLDLVVKWLEDEQMKEKIRKGSN